MPHPWNLPSANRRAEAVRVRACCLYWRGTETRGHSTSRCPGCASAMCTDMPNGQRTLDGQRQRFDMCPHSETHQEGSVGRSQKPQCSCGSFRGLGVVAKLSGAVWRLGTTRTTTPVPFLFITMCEDMSGYLDETPGSKCRHDVQRSSSRP